MIGFNCMTRPLRNSTESANEKTRAIADDSTDSAGFTCPVGMRLTALFYSIMPAETDSLLQTFLLHHIGHPEIGYIDRYLEIWRGEQADLLQALGQLPFPLRVKARFPYDILHVMPRRPSPEFSIKKERSYLPKIRTLLVSVNTGGQDAYLISSATRLSFLFLDPWLCVAGLLRFCPFGERL